MEEVLTILVDLIFRVWDHGNNIICELMIPLPRTLARVDLVSMH